jgi:hypothetical protein
MLGLASGYAARSCTGRNPRHDPSIRVSPAGRPRVKGWQAPRIRKSESLQRAKLLPLIVACALFMENTDSTVIATSLPVIAKSLGEDPIALKLALTSYLVSLAVFIPISGWMADRFGARTIFRAALCGVHARLGALRACRTRSAPSSARASSRAWAGR